MHICVINLEKKKSKGPYFINGLLVVTFKKMGRLAAVGIVSFGGYLEVSSENAAK